MNKELYSVIFKRKSFHLFRGVGSDSIEQTELEEIKEAFAGFDRLYPDIRTEIKIVPAAKVNFKRDAEYCILIYSEEKDNWLMNAGYLGEQLDLYLVSKDIGTLWYGIGKPDSEKLDGLSYAIMLAIHKVKDASLYRKDMYAAKRKPLEEIWTGDTLGAGEIARFSPSACNSQPWRVKSENGALSVFRYRKPGRSGIMSAEKAFYYNRIDMGIFLCILELCLMHEGISFERELFSDSEDVETVQVAEYSVAGS